MGEIEVSSLLVVIVHLALLISLNGWANSYYLSKLDKCGMWLLDAVCSMQGPDAMHIRFGQANSADKTDHVNNNCQDNIFLGFWCLGSLKRFWYLKLNPIFSYVGQLGIFRKYKTPQVFLQTF